MSAIKMSVGGTATVIEPDPRVKHFTAVLDSLIESVWSDMARSPIESFRDERDTVIRLFRNSIEAK